MTLNTLNPLTPTARFSSARIGATAALAIMVAALLVPVISSDAAAEGVSAYLGGGVGVASSKFDADHLHFDADDLSPSETSWRLFAGSRFHPNLGMEIGYVSIDEARITENVNDDFFEVQVTGVDVSGLLIVPLVPGLMAYGRAGLVFWSSDFNYRFTDIGSGSDSESGSNIVLGLGAQLDLSRTLGLRAEYSRYEVDKAEAGVGDISMISANALLLFGGSGK